MSLANLVKTNQLEPHPFDAAECAKLLAGARRALQDAQVAGLSDTTRMSLAYDAIQALCAIALRLHGYRPATRTPGHHALVIQLLETTLAAPVRAVPYPHDGWVTIDIVAVDAGKGAALAALALEHGFEPQHCAAVGDYLNDIPMLEWAGWSVAMGQAPAQVRAVADAVVAPVTEHGAAQALAAIVAATL